MGRCQSTEAFSIIELPDSSLFERHDNIDKRIDHNNHKSGRSWIRVELVKRSQFLLVFIIMQRGRD